MDKKTTLYNPKNSLKTTICIVITGGGKSKAHSMFKEVSDADVGQAKLCNHVSLAKAYINAGGRSIGMSQSTSKPGLTIHEFTGAESTVTVQGKYEERIYHPDNPNPTLEILAREVSKNRGGIVMIPLEDESFALLPEFTTDPRFKHVQIVIVHPENNTESMAFLDNRYARRGNNSSFRKQKKEDFSRFIVTAEKLCRGNPEYRQIILKKTKHTIKLNEHGYENESGARNYY